MRYSNPVYHALKDSFDFRKRQFYAFIEDPLEDIDLDQDESGEDGEDKEYTREVREMALYG
jgi:hypothetical protein